MRKGGVCGWGVCGRGVCAGGRMCGIGCITLQTVSYVTNNDNNDNLVFICTIINTIIVIVVVVAGEAEAVSVRMMMVMVTTTTVTVTINTTTTTIIIIIIMFQTKQCSLKLSTEQTCRAVPPPTPPQVSVVWLLSKLACFSSALLEKQKEKIKRRGLLSAKQ